MSYYRNRGYGRHYSKPTPRADIRSENGSLVLDCSYDASLVNWIKTLPNQDRAWHSDSKTWKIAPKHSKSLQDAILRYLGITVQIPVVEANPDIPRFLSEDMFYIGGAYTRGSNPERTATGYVGGEWAWIFPETVLRKWFGEKDPKPSSILNHYAVLGVSQSCTEDELKKAYRKASKMYHPDINKESDAEVQFKRIQRAYDVLREPYSRERYDVGLRLQSQVGFGERSSTDKVYFTPLRCGRLEVIATPAVGGKFVVNAIKAWNDIIQNGKMLVTTWPKGAEKFIEQWVEV